MGGQIPNCLLERRPICLSRQREGDPFPFLLRSFPLPFFRLFIFRRQLHFLLFSQTPKTVCPTGERLQPASQPFLSSLPPSLHKILIEFSKSGGAP